MITDDPSPRRAVILAVLLILITLIYSWLQTGWKYEYRKTETPNEIVGYSAGYCGLNPRGMEKSQNYRIDYRTKTIERFLDKYNPDMRWIASIVVGWSDYYHTDPYLVVAIGSLEQDYLRSCYYNNCWGHSVNGEYLQYGSVEEGIKAAVKLLGNKLYSGKSIAQIGPIYCPTKGGCDTSHWIKSVTTIYNNITDYEN